jgi:hypothetical protein
MAVISYSTLLGIEIRASLADIISSDAAGIVAEYSLRIEQEKLICVLETARSNGRYNGCIDSIQFDTKAFGGKITMFEIQTHGPLTMFESKYYAIVISGPYGELGCGCRFNDLCIDSSYWITRGRSKLWQTARDEYRRQMLELMARY